MAQGYYFKPKKAKNKNKRQGGSSRSRLIMVLDVIAWGALGLVTGLLIMAMLARYVSPAGLGYLFAFAGLLFPILFICEVVVALYWTVRWKWVAIAVGAFLLFCLPDARLFYKPDITKHYDLAPPPKEGVVVMSYNVMGFGYGGVSNRKMESTATKIADFIASQNVDILCTQEFLIKEGFTDEFFDSRITDLKYSYAVTYSNPEGANGVGIAIYSRYPILARGTVNMADDFRRSIWCDVRVNRDTVRIFSNHLQNTNITSTDEDYMAQSFFVDSNARFGKIRSIAQRLRDAYRLRAPQADSVALAIKASPYKVIVCGDFNDTPLSYAYHHIARGLKDSYVAKGAGAMGTYHGFFNMFRIDYILYSPGLRAIRFEVSDVVLSDHNPIISELTFDKPDIYGR